MLLYCYEPLLHDVVLHFYFHEVKVHQHYYKIVNKATKLIETVIYSLEKIILLLVLVSFDLIILVFVLVSQIIFVLVLVSFVINNYRFH